MTKNASSINAPDAEMHRAHALNANVSRAGASYAVDTQEDRALGLLRALANEDGQSLPRLARRLGLAASELQRLLVALGNDPQFAGLGLVEARNDSRGRNCIWLTARGQSLCEGMLPASMLPEGLRSEGIRERDAT
jgi:hypothetical protein